MKLRSLEIENYRSLEHVRLDRLAQLNVLIGRNNSGKTAILAVVSLLNQVIHGSVQVDWSTVLTSHDSTRSLRVKLTVDVEQREREDLIDLLITAGHRDDRRGAMRDSPLARQVEFTFGSPVGLPSYLHLRSTRMIAEDNQWGDIQELVGEDRSGNPIMRRKALGEVAKRYSNDALHSGILDIKNSTDIDERRQQVNLVAGEQVHPDAATRWPLERLATYLEKAFFFNPFRHSAARLNVTATPRLAQDGSNLAQVLHTINSNDRPLFRRIEEFVYLALPDVGTLQVPLIDGQTEVAFRSEDGGYLTRLHDMGGGVEQLLMVATVLLTTGDDSTLFVEEPESHLHPGAQRFLAEKLGAGERQVFVTTHSPTFVNIPGAPSIYLVRYRSRRTSVERAADTQILSTALADIGSRNSDVLLSDAVLFVEGPSDASVLLAWSEQLGMSLDEHSVTVLPMGGGEFAERAARVRSDVLEGISQKSPVPHMFVLDRDERSRVEIHRLRGTLRDRVHILERRELENYLLFPRAVLDAIRFKHRDNSAILERTESLKEKDIARLMEQVMSDLYGLILLKRIRGELGGLLGGLLPRELAVQLAAGARDTGLARLLESKIKSRIDGRLAEIGLDRIVSEERTKLDEEWTDAGRRWLIAPGSEILSKVFEHFGGEYKKPEDAVRIAKGMRAEEIPEEVRDLIQKATRLNTLDSERTG